MNDEGDWRIDEFESNPLKLNLKQNQKLFTRVKDVRSTKHRTIIVLANLGINKTESPTNHSDVRDLF